MSTETEITMPTMTGVRAHRARRRTMLSLPLLLAGCALLAACTVQRLDERVIAPELGLETTHITEGITRWRLTVRKDTATRELGVMTSAQRYADYLGRSAILFGRTVQNAPGGHCRQRPHGSAHGFAPVWEPSEPGRERPSCSPSKTGR